MESDLRCNHLSCRRTIIDKAVVTTCSHIFCVECANNLFTAAQTCPACEATLTEPDDVVIASLRPTNDYKTSVLSGLSPAVILEICGRAIAFWQYQIHQEGSYQQAILKSLNEKNTQVSKQLENVVREANGELTMLNNKVADLERELELEKRKNRDIQAASRAKDKEYQKLKNQFDNIKRKALLGSNVGPSVPLAAGPNFPVAGLDINQATYTRNNTSGVTIGEVANGMNAHGVLQSVCSDYVPLTPNVKVQRTPINTGRPSAFNPQLQEQMTRHVPHRTSLGANSSISDISERDVENILGQRHVRKSVNGSMQTGYTNSRGLGNQRVLPPPSGRRASGGFRPAGFGR